MTTTDKPDLYVEHAARRLHLDRLATLLPWSFISGPLLLVWLLLLIDVPVLSTVGFLTTSDGIYTYKLWLLVPVGLTFAVWALLRLRDAYINSVDSLPSRGTQSDRDELMALVSARHRQAILLLWWVGYLMNIALDPQGFFKFIALEGVIIGLLKQGIIFFGYVPLLAEFTALVFTVHVLCPLHLWYREYPLDFSDVTGFGGIRKVGDLLKRSTTLYFLGLLVYTIASLAPGIITTAYPGPTSLQLLLFPILWGMGLVLYAVPVLIIHRHVAAEKRRELERIDHELRNLDPDDTHYPYVDPPKDRIPEYTHKFLKLQQIRTTRNYPTNVTILEDIVLAALLPLIVQNGLLYVATHLF